MVGEGEVDVEGLCDGDGRSFTETVSTGMVRDGSISLLRVW